MYLDKEELCKHFKWLVLLIIFTLIIGASLIFSTNILDGQSKEFASVSGAILVVFGIIGMCISCVMFGCITFSIWNGS